MLVSISDKNTSQMEMNTKHTNNFFIKNVSQCYVAPLVVIVHEGTIMKPKNWGKLSYRHNLSLFLANFLQSVWEQLLQIRVS